MTTRADFYLIDSDQPQAVYQAACRVAEKAVSANMTVWIRCSNQGEAAHLDQLLWQFDANSFVPHELVDTDSEASQQDKQAGARVMISAKASPDCQLVINLTDKPVEPGNSLQRVAEIVGNGEHQRAGARARYRQYSQAGWEMHSHEL